MSLTIVLICICLILVGAITGKPMGYVVLGLGVLALLLHVLGVPALSLR